MSIANNARPLGLFIQPACLQHRYIRHANSSHIFERPERLRAVLVGVAAAVARLEEAEENFKRALRVEPISIVPQDARADVATAQKLSTAPSDDLSSMLSSLSINSGTSSFTPPHHLNIVPPPLPPSISGQLLLHHPALQLAHSPTPESPFPTASSTSSPYLKDLFKWASEAVEKIKETGSEIPAGRGLNPSDLYLGPGSILAVEGAIQTVCQAIDRLCEALPSLTAKVEPSTPPIPQVPDTSQATLPQPSSYFESPSSVESSFTKAFCAIRPPGHHCGEDTPSGFCYVNNVVVGAMHGYLEHDVDRAVIIDFDLHHGNGTQALVMPLNAASHAEDLAVQGGKPASLVLSRKGKRRRGWKGFYGSVHDIYSYPCEVGSQKKIIRKRPAKASQDGDIDLVKDASISLAGHGQYIENIHLQPYSSEADFYERIYPKYLALLDKAKTFMEETGAEPERTIVFISAGFDACEHEHQGMQRHDRRVPTSFFARYTRDLVAFADRYTEGKVISVLEGGYSDRALTSAAMGHIIGLLDESEGTSDWWTEAELINIEKATKKKRTGRIAPFPTELSSQSYLLRTHALLAHFEGPSVDLPTYSASATNTPQQSARMTLRNRGRLVNGDTESPTGARQATRSTPRTKTATASSGTPSGKKPVKALLSMEQTATSSNVETPSNPKEGNDADLHEAISDLAGVKLGEPSHEREGEVTAVAGALPSLARPTDITGVESLPIPAIIRPEPERNDALQPHGGLKAQQKIILRIPRPSPPPPTVPPDSSPLSHSNDGLYPPLPAAAQGGSRKGRLDYREDSVGSSSSLGASVTEREYASAPSGMSDVERGARELSTGTSGSEGPVMPGALPGFGRSVLQKPEE